MVGRCETGARPVLDVDSKTETGVSTETPWLFLAGAEPSNTLEHGGRAAKAMARRMHAGDATDRRKVSPTQPHAAHAARCDATRTQAHCAASLCIRCVNVAM